MSEGKMLIHNLMSKEVSINKLLLDPNNPRFSALKKKISTNKISDDVVQKKTLTDISKFGVDELKDSIQNIGFLPIDRIVVVKLEEKSDFYVVIEGNRRIASVKSLLQDINEGLEIDSQIVKSLEKINVLSIENMTYDNSSDYQLLIQGLRHISGVKSWKPYQQSRALVALVDQLNYSITDAAATLGMGRSTASWMKKAFYAFEEMRKDDEVELPRDDDEVISYFSYFVEILKDVNLRQYLGWDDSNNKFTNRIEILKLYKWLGLSEIQEGSTRQIPSALDIRKLYTVLSNNDAKRILESGGSINDAYSVFSVTPQLNTDYTRKLKDIYVELKNLPSTFVKHMSEEDKTFLKNIIEIVEEHLQ
ncbi:hypothetical protein SAMN05443428_12821 [Caloramator quimbayensis]|uniref:ParB/Sulfiredoxin domain-containing protein n=1 Tax=Caloramator quimbayensis TaxID=1147123 RepID=A0A1T4Y9D9_9CLOT|nr:ParB/Srx family N-terminal domain-containing protein [Caloramator quimbayensis]SKA98313.1 hypothetical protein SAMN05443428_12821 [Caloramator quimbayensis]